MGMTIEDAGNIIDRYDMNFYDDNGHKIDAGLLAQAFDTALDIMRKYQMFQADYENRLKADMVAMLQDLDLQIDELAAYNLEVAKVQRLIRDRINELPLVTAQEPRWIPVKWHNITEEEREQEGYPKEWLTMLDCLMPNDEEEILVTVKSSRGGLYVEKDICYVDDGYSLDSGYDWIDDVIAWMPLPNPYKTESEDKDVFNT